MLKESGLILSLLQGLFEYLLLFPLFLMLGVYIVPNKLMWIWLGMIPCLFFMGLLYRKIFLNQSWWKYVTYSLMLGIFTSFPYEKNILFLILVAILHVIIIYRGIMYIGSSWEELLPTSFYWVGGLSIYFVGYILFQYLENLHPYQDILTVLGLFMIILILFISNNYHLRYSTLSKEKKPFISRNIKNQNRVFLVITVVIIFLVANGKMVKDGLWSLIRSIVQWLFSSESSSPKIIEEPPPLTNQPPPFLMEDDKGPSVLAQVLEMVMTFITYILAGIGIIIIVLLLIKKTRDILLNAARKLYNFLKQLGNQFSEDEEAVQYIDEKENIFDWQDWKEERQKRVKSIVKNIFKRKPSWDSLSNSEKVRFIYKHFLTHNIPEDYDSSLTPREVIERINDSISAGDEVLLVKLRNAYEQVRYGDKKVDNMIIQDIYSLIQEK